MKIILNLLISLLFIILTISCTRRNCTCDNCVCSDCRCKDCRSDNCKCIVVSDTLEMSPLVYNLFIDNSGSMRGFFNAQTLKTILQEYYSGIKVMSDDDDIITFNFINTSKTNTNIEHFDGNVKDFLNSAVSKCNASYSDIGDMLAVAMDSLREGDTNLMVSDYSFTSPDGNLGMAQAKITEQFGERLKKRDISIAIMKYDCDFNGMYYPGPIPCTHDMPIYIWVFGDNKNVKAITHLPIKESAEIMTLQATQILEPTYKVPKARMLDKTTNSIIVSQWPKDRKSISYSLQFTIDMSSILMEGSYLAEESQYSITNGYSIDSIVQQGYDTYLFTISTDKPSPKTIEISLPYSLPEWVDESNFSGVGVPPSGQTQNVKYLLEGVYDAYHNKSAKSFTISIKLI